MILIRGQLFAQFIDILLTKVFELYINLDLCYEFDFILGYDIRRALDN